MMGTSSTVGRDSSTNIIEERLLSTIGETCDVFSGIGFPKIYQGNPAGDFPFYKVSDISRCVSTGGKFLSRAENSISFQTSTKLKGKIVHPLSIVFAKIGEALKLNRRAITTVPCFVDNNVMVIYPDAKKVSYKFLYFFFLTLDLSHLSRATTIPSIRKTDIESIPIPLPPLDEQKKIVEKIERLFSELESGVAALKKAKEQIKLYRQSVLSAAFSGRLTDPERLHGIQEVSRSNKNKLTSAENDTLIAAEPAAAYTTNLPEGWRWYSISDIANDMIIGMVKSSKEQSSTKEGVPYIKMNNIDMEGSVDLKEVVYVKATNVEIKKYELLKGDILFNTRNSYELVGKTGIVDDSNVTRVFNNNLLRIRVKCEFNPKFINYQMNSSAFREKLKSGKRATTNICAIYQKDLFPLTLSIPDKYIQDLIVAEIEKRFAEADNMEKTIDESLAKAEALKQSILKQAFEGKLV